jgi:hypothetical protein
MFDLDIACFRFKDVGLINSVVLSETHVVFEAWRDSNFLPRAISGSETAAFSLFLALSPQDKQIRFL